MNVHEPPSTDAEPRAISRLDGDATGSAPRRTARTRASSRRVQSRTGRGSGRSPVDKGVVERLSFLHEFAQLATHARDWDELMRTVVDRTTVAMGVEVCSFYLLDRDGQTLTLAATNGLDREQVGRVSLAMHQGITGRAAAQREPVMSQDVTVDERFSWVRGFDIAGLHAMLSMPLVWNEQVVGALNVQTTAIRDFEPAEIEFLATIAALLAGIVEKGRLQAEAEAQLDRLSQLDAARAELLAVVTHELRTPLAVVRAYVDLLADAAATNARGPVGRRHRELAAPARPTRSPAWTGWSTRSWRRSGARGSRACAGSRSTWCRRSTATVGTLALLLRTRLRALERAGLRARGPGRRDALPPGAGAPARQRGQVRAARAGGRRSACGGPPRRSRSTSPTTGRASRSRTGRPCSSRTCGSTACARGARGSGCSPRAG